MADPKRDFDGNILPEDVTSMIISMHDIANRADEIHTIVEGKVPFDPVTAMGMMMMGFAMMRFFGIPPKTCMVVAEGILDTYKDMPNTGKEGRLIHNSVKEIDEAVKRCFMAKGNDTLN